MTSKVDVTTYFSDSEEENEEESKEVIDDSKIVIVVKKTKKGKEGTYLTGIPKKEVTEVNKDGDTVKAIKAVKVVLNDLKQEFVKKNSTGCAVKENKPDTKNFLSFIPKGGFYLFLQGEHDKKLKEFLEQKGYSDIIVRS